MPSFSKVFVATTAALLGYGAIFSSAEIAGVEAAEGEYQFKLLPDPTMPELDNQGYMGVKVKGTTDYYLVCADTITPVAAVLACRAADYTMSELVEAGYQGRPAAAFDPNAQIALWNIQCNSYDDTFPCEYNLNPAPEDCGNALFLDCSAGTPNDPTGGVFNFYYAFFVKREGAPTLEAYADRLKASLVTYLERVLTASVPVDRIRLILAASLTSTAQYGNKDSANTFIYAFNFSFTNAVYPPRDRLELATSTDPFDHFPRDMKLAYVVAIGTNGMPPAGPAFSFEIVPVDPTRPWSGYVTVTPSSTGVAGTICTDGIVEGPGSTLANAMCIAAGFKDATNAVAKFVNNYDPIREEMPILWRNFDCAAAATSKSVDDCSFLPIDAANTAPQCYHGIDLNVDCYNGGAPPEPPTPYLRWAFTFNASKMNVNTATPADDELLRSYGLSVIRQLTGIPTDTRLFVLGFSRYPQMDPNYPADPTPTFTVTVAVKDPATPPADVDISTIPPAETAPRSYYDAAIYGWTRHHMHAADTNGAKVYTPDGPLASYLILNVSSNSTLPDGAVAAFTGLMSPNKVYLSAGTHGHLVVERRDANDAVTARGTGCTNEMEQRDDAYAICRFLSPLITTRETIAAVGAIPRYKGASAERFGPMLVQGRGCHGGAFSVCFEVVPDGTSATCDFDHTATAICGHAIEAISTDARFRNVNVVNFNISLGVGFDWDQFVYFSSSLFSIDSSRFTVRESGDGYIIFHINDGVSADFPAVPRVFYEQFFMHTDWAVLEEARITGITWIRGAPYSPPPPSGFHPTDITGWYFTLEPEGGNVAKGLLRVMPPNSPGGIYGSVCADAFFTADASINAFNARAVCRTLFGIDVPTVHAYDRPVDPIHASDPMYITNVYCPNEGTPAKDSADQKTGLDGCSMNLFPSSGGAPMGVCESGNPVYIDCSIVTTGTVNFTFVSQQQPFDAENFRQVLADFMETSVHRIVVEIAATHTANAASAAGAEPIETVFYSVRFNTAEDNSPTVETLEQIAKAISAEDLVERLSCLERRSSDVIPSGVPASAEAVANFPSWSVELVSDFSSTMSKKFGRIEIQPEGDRGDVNRWGTLCGDNVPTNARIGDVTLSSFICSTMAGGSSDVTVSRLIKHVRPADDIIYVGGIYPTDTAPYYFGLLGNTMLTKNDKCSHLSDMGLICGSNLRPSGLPIIFRAHFLSEDRTISSADDAVRAIATAAEFSERNIQPIEFVNSTDDSHGGMVFKYLEFSFVDDDADSIAAGGGFKGDDYALMVTHLSGYALRTFGLIDRLEIVRDWVDPATITTTAVPQTTSTPVEPSTTEEPTTSSSPSSTSSSSTSATDVVPTTDASTDVVPTSVTSDVTSSATDDGRSTSAAVETTASSPTATNTEPLPSTSSDVSSSPAPATTTIDPIATTTSGSSGPATTIATSEAPTASEQPTSQEPLTSAAFPRPTNTNITAKPDDGSDAAPDGSGGSDSSGSSSTGIIIGVVVGIVAIVAVVVGVVMYRKRAARPGKAWSHDNDYGPLELEAQSTMTNGGGDLNIQRM